jgi:hypothetical protein
MLGIKRHIVTIPLPFGQNKAFPEVQYSENKYVMVKADASPFNT